MWNAVLPNNTGSVLYLVQRRSFSGSHTHRQHSLNNDDSLTSPWQQIEQVTIRLVYHSTMVFVKRNKCRKNCQRQKWDTTMQHAFDLFSLRVVGSVISVLRSSDFGCHVDGTYWVVLSMSCRLFHYAVCPSYMLRLIYVLFVQKNLINISRSEILVVERGYKSGTFQKMSVMHCGVTKTDRVFSEREFKFMFAICHRRSVCLSSVVCLSSITFVHPTQAIEICGNISTPCGTLAIHDLCIKILRRSSQGNPSVGGVKHNRGSRIQRFWTYPTLYLGNGERQELSLY